MARAAKAHAMPPWVLNAGSAPPVPPVASQLPQPAKVPAVDVAALASEYAATGQTAAAQALSGGPQLLVFVSLSMPEGALLRLVEQGARAKAVLLLRGLEGGSLVKTMAHVHKLLGQRQVALQIDPQAFDRFGVRQVPTFVLLREGGKGQDCGAGTCFAPDAYLSVAGDVTIDYALEHITSRAPRFAREARVFLNRLKE
ncbi:type-F conjugative transfer system pilin assembly protein TrbC [Massilia sp. YIM B04103]|uniref:type-F conjugative transfer system pilin assembly protein TrbC n=1 Tax=Massilia sp. YIM B04103 TaxID=2963106 RepID=UPI00210A8983|nr:type-F conjugative transfer system pilin assembly protein TrbC [Massilia sp. YIM B04103]